MDLGIFFHLRDSPGIHTLRVSDHPSLELAGPVELAETVLIKFALGWKGFQSDLDLQVIDGHLFCSDHFLFPKSDFGAPVEVQRHNVVSSAHFDPKILQKVPIAFANLERNFFDGLETLIRRDDIGLENGNEGRE